MKTSFSLFSVIGICLLLFCACQTTSILPQQDFNKQSAQQGRQTQVNKQTSVVTTQKQTIVSEPVAEPKNIYSYHYQEATARHSNPKRSETYIYPNVADLEVTPNKITHSQIFSTRMEMTASQFRKFTEEFNRHINSGTEPAFVKNWKSQVIANAAMKYQADEIVAPIFIITPSADKTEVEVKVTGYVGKYKNFRKATEKDINFLNTYNGNLQ